MDRVGLHALGQLADRLGLGDALSSAVPWTGERAPVHARGKVLTQAALMLAGGGECCADIEDLRVEDRLFGSVPSDSTLQRVMHELDGATRDEMAVAVAGVRAKVWERAGLCKPRAKTAVVLDIDATLVEIHSENKQQTAPTYKGGFGFHPMLCFADATGETLAALLRPGNAGANNATDHLAVLDAAVGQLPGPVSVGHRDSDDATMVKRKIVVRADSAGATRGFTDGCRDRNIGFAVVARSTPQIHAAISKILADKTRWHVARRQNGKARKGAAVAEITDLVNLSSWPTGTRLIVRREPLHPGAQHTLFPSLAYRYWGHYTDQDGNPVALDTFMRAHAHVEDHIKRLKDSGLERFPFRSFEANQNWLATVALGSDLVRWFQLLCLDGSLAAAEPKALRWKLWNTPARIIRRSRRDVIRIIDTGPAADILLAAYTHIAAIT